MHGLHAQEPLSAFGVVFRYSFMHIFIYVFPDNRERSAQRVWCYKILSPP